MGALLSLELDQAFLTTLFAAIAAAAALLARSEEGRGGGTSRLPVIRRQLDVALGIFARLGGPPLPKCVELATLTGTDPATPVFPSLSEAFQIVERCLDEIRTALDDESLTLGSPRS